MAGGWQGLCEISLSRMGAAMRLVGLSVATWELKMMWQQIIEFDPENINTAIGLPEFVSLMIMLMQHLEIAPAEDGKREVVLQPVQVTKPPAAPFASNYVTLVLYMSFSLCHVQSSTNVATGLAVLIESSIANTQLLAILYNGLVLFDYHLLCLHTRLAFQFHWNEIHTGLRLMCGAIR